MTNRDGAIEFLQLCARGEVRTAYDRHVAPGFVHHNPWFAKTGPGSIFRSRRSP